MKACAGLAWAALAVVGASAALAQSYPLKPIRVASDSASGSPGDVALRLVAVKMGAALGQPVVVETKTGAGGQIAATDVIRSGANGYSLLFSSSIILISRFMLKNVFVDLQRDLVPISMAARGNNFLVVHASVLANSVKELVEHARRNPGSLSFSSNGIGSSLHLQWLSFMLATDTSLLHVPYGSGNNSQRLSDFLIGRTSLVLTPYGSVKPYLEAGKVRALAMVSDQRNRQAPDVPAITEVIPNYKLFVGFWGFWGPAGLPQPIVERLSEEIQKGFRDAETAARLEALDVQAVGNTPQEFAALIRSQLLILEDLVKAAGIKPE